MTLSEFCPMVPVAPRSVTVFVEKAGRAVGAVMVMGLFDGYLAFIKVAGLYHLVTNLHRANSQLILQID